MIRRSGVLKTSGLRCPQVFASDCRRDKIKKLESDLLNKWAEIILPKHVFEFPVCNIMI